MIDDYEYMIKGLSQEFISGISCWLIEIIIFYFFFKQKRVTHCESCGGYAAAEIKLGT